MIALLATQAVAASLPETPKTIEVEARYFRRQMHTGNALALTSSALVVGLTTMTVVQEMNNCQVHCGVASSIVGFGLGGVLLPPVLLTSAYLSTGPATRLRPGLPTIGRDIAAASGVIGLSAYMINGVVGGYAGHTIWVAMATVVSVSSVAQLIYNEVEVKRSLRVGVVPNGRGASLALSVVH